MKRILKKPQETASDLTGVARLTLPRASIVSGYSIWHLRKLVWSNKVTYERIGHKILIDHASLLRYIETVKAA